MQCNHYNCSTLHQLQYHDLYTLAFLPKRELVLSHFIQIKNNQIRQYQQTCLYLIIKWAPEQFYISKVCATTSQDL